MERNGRVGEKEEKIIERKRNNFLKSTEVLSDAKLQILLVLNYSVTI